MRLAHRPFSRLHPAPPRFPLPPSLSLSSPALVTRRTCADSPKKDTGKSQSTSSRASFLVQTRIVAWQGVFLTARSAIRPAFPSESVALHSDATRCVVTCRRTMVDSVPRVMLGTTASWEIVKRARVEKKVSCLAA